MIRPDRVDERWVLVVEDDFLIRASVSASLGDAGYPVREAANGIEALAQMERGIPSLVLLDLRMPFVNGWEFVDELRKRGLQLPIYLMTAHPEAHQLSQELGACGVLAKPFDLDQLLGLVERWLGPSVDQPLA